MNAGVEPSTGAVPRLIAVWLGAESAQAAPGSVSMNSTKLLPCRTVEMEV
jgi:hypothetical protein